MITTLVSGQMQPGLRICCLFIIAVAAGCGSNLPQTVKVTGRVTFDGKAPPGPGSVYFMPTDAAAGFPSRPATGDFDKDGHYKAQTFEPGDGLMPGKYIMSIECWQSPPNLEGAPVRSFVPTKYQTAQTSGFQLDITPQMKAQEVNLDLVTK